MASKVFVGNVSIYKNTKGEIAVQKDSEGKFSAENVAECLTMVRKLAKEHKAAINKYSLLLVDGGTEPVLMVNRFGNPYIALLPKRVEGTAKRSVTKLA